MQQKTTDFLSNLVRSSDRSADLVGPNKWQDRRDSRGCREYLISRSRYGNATGNTRFLVCHNQLGGQFLRSLALTSQPIYFHHVAIQFLAKSPPHSKILKDSHFPLPSFHALITGNIVSIIGLENPRDSVSHSAHQTAMLFNLLQLTLNFSRC